MDELREAVSMFGKCEDEDVEAIVQQMDKDGNGTIDLDEFVNVIRENVE